MISPEVPGRAEIADLLPLAPLQRELLAFELRHASALCNGQAVLGVSGRVDAQVLRAAGQTLLDRHPNLRAGFAHSGAARPVQVIARRVPLPWRAVDLSGADCPGVEAGRLAAEELARPFPLDRPPLVRLLLVTLGPGEHRIVLTHHAIVLDGWSVPLAMTDLFVLYMRHQGELPLPSAIPYRRQLDWLSAQDAGAARTAWRTALDGVAEPTLLVPAAAGRSPLSPRQVTLELGETLSQRLRTTARTLRLTLNTMVQGAWGLLLSRLTGRDDVVFGALVSGRPPDLPHVDQMVGQFVNTVPVRLRVRHDAPLAELLAALQEEQVELFPHQHLPLSELGPPLFDTLTVFENCPFDPDSLPDTSFAGLRLTEAGYRAGTPFPITLHTVPGARLTLRLDHRPDVLGGDDALRMLRRLERVLTIAATAPRTPAGEIDVVLPLERDQLLLEFSGPAAPVPTATPADVFEMQAIYSGHCHALLTPGRPPVRYAELNQRANRLAAELLARGTGPERLVAGLLRSPEHLVVAQLATLKTGAGYVPLSPDAGADRLRAVLADAAPTVVLTDGGTVPPGVAPVLDLDRADLSERSDRDPGRRTLLPDHPAYVLYGADGRGTVVTHSGVIRMVSWALRRFGAGRLRRVRTVAVGDRFDTLLPLTAGGRVEFVTAAAADPAEPAALLVGAPAQIASLAGRAAAATDLVMVGEGDPALLRPVRAARPDARLTLLYGPAEASLFGTWLNETDLADSPDGVALGHPLPGVRAYVLDRRLRLVPPGVRGELYLAGEGLARGYLHHPAATADRFVADPYGPPGTRMFRTGEPARWRITPDGADGVLERADGPR